ncbi:glycosyltransferase family 4 protein [Maribacter sp. Asnod1-A12]|uniref:glycosyltransferase family 4 protein n=1 Tax=Maribacter sp. Asnod1-A12 TaxID=3160576 RepID=UPI00386F7A40
MKIDLMINAIVGGGAERVMVTLANAFSNKDNIVNLITFNPGNAYKTNPSVAKVNLHYGKIKNHSIRSFINSFKYYKKKNNRPDILISFMPSNNLIAILMGCIFNIKVIISEHNNHLANPSSKFKWIRKILYRYADATTVLTSYDVPFYKNLKANVVIMPNPVELPFKTKPFKQRQKNILIAGSLNRYQVKGFDKFLPIIAPILKNNPEWKLIIAGNGDNGLKLLQDLTNNLKIQNQVDFLGFCNNMEEIMQNSKLFILPSKSEGLPMVLIEALSNGMACVAYDCISGPSDLINHNKNGFLIENQNSEILKSSIYHLIENEELMEQLGTNAKISLENYSLNKVIMKWDKLIKSVING